MLNIETLAKYRYYPNTVAARRGKEWQSSQDNTKEHIKMKPMESRMTTNMEIDHI